jgi:hypothetical protein
MFVKYYNLVSMRTILSQYSNWPKNWDSDLDSEKEERYLSSPHYADWLWSLSSLSTVEKWTACGADHSPPFSVVVKNALSSTSFPHIFMVLCIIKHMNAFIFILLLWCKHISHNYKRFEAFMAVKIHIVIFCFVII